MSAKSRISFYNTTAFLCGIWFLCTGWLWPYLMNLIVAFPFGIIGMVLWYKGHQATPNSKWNRAALVVHIAGLAVSITSLIIFEFYN